MTTKRVVTTRSRHLAAVTGCIVSSIGWALATESLVMRVCLVVLLVSWAYRWLAVYREPRRTVTLYVPEGAERRGVVVMDEDTTLKVCELGDLKL
jgi:hypothetical protein